MKRKKIARGKSARQLKRLRRKSGRVHRSHKAWLVAPSFRAFVDQANAGLARYGLDGKIEFVNRTFCKMLGYREHELIGKNIRHITHPDDLKRTIDAFDRVSRKGEAVEIDKRYIRKKGGVVWVNVCDGPERDLAGRPKSVVAVVIDITARKKAESALQKSKETLAKLVDKRTKALRMANVDLQNEINRRRGLEGEILRVTDREQQRLGRELHDNLCQQLTATAFFARSTALRLKNHRVIEVVDLEKITGFLNEAVREARAIARDLHREDIPAAELHVALRDLATRKFWSVPCRLEMKTHVEIDDDEAASHIYRLLREAIINANKHAQATRIVLKVRRTKNHFVFSVSDNGVGLNGQKNGNGLGFETMGYRAEALRGRLVINSPKEGGTQVICYVPVQR